ncbi:MAG: hypothetical protein ACK4YO_03235 [Candidatus Altarchaeaceae archaeon]
MYTFNELFGLWIRVLRSPKQGVQEVMSKNPTLMDGIIAGAIAGGIVGLITGVLGFLITLIFGFWFLGIFFLILGPIIGAIEGGIEVLIGAVIYYIIAMLFGGKTKFNVFCGVYGVAVSPIILLSSAVSLAQMVISMVAGVEMVSSAFLGSYGAVAGAFGTLMIIQAIFLIISLLIIVYAIFIISKVIQAVYNFDSEKALLVAAIPIIVVVLIMIISIFGITLYHPHMYYSGPYNYTQLTDLQVQATE